MPRTSILLADDNFAVLNCVRKMLEKDYEILAAVHDGKSVLRDWPHLRPDLIVLDVSLGEPNGIEVAELLRNTGCNSKIVFLTIHRDPHFVKAAIDAGGLGYVVKSRMSKDLVLALQAALSGKQFVSPSLAQMRG